MEGIAYFDSSPGWERIVPRPDQTFDEFAWFFDCQGGWNVLDLDYDGLDAMHGQCLVSLPKIENTSTSLIKPDCFRQAFPWFGCDEWTYLLGFQAKEADYEKCAERLTGFLSRECFDALKDYNGILIVCVADWWECFPSNHPLIPLLGSDLVQAPTGSDKWIAHKSDYRVKIRPEFGFPH